MFRELLCCLCTGITLTTAMPSKCIWYSKASKWHPWKGRIPSWPSFTALQKDSAIQVFPIGNHFPPTVLSKGTVLEKRRRRELPFELNRAEDISLDDVKIEGDNRVQ